ncbi:MAG: endonuclease domain-containing protein [Candidatus Binataceae bacterium]
MRARLFSRPSAHAASLQLSPSAQHLGYTARMDTPSSPTEKARRLRRAQTDAERLLWARLRGQQCGFKFRRQFPIGPFIVDFCCPRCGLVIEVDGEQHADEIAVEADRRRSDFIATQGYSVLRFWNHEVLADADAVAQKIVECLAHRTRP